MTTTTDRRDDEGSTAPTLEETVARLVADARDARTATAALGSSAESARSAEQRYADEVATSLATLEFDLRAAQAALDARRADTSDDLRSTIDEVEQAARSWLDDLPLQTRLGRMELRDRADAVSRRLDRARAEAQRAVGRVSDAVESDLDQMRRVTLTGIGEIRTALTDAVAALRDLDD